jgi:hypothetical protein
MFRIRRNYWFFLQVWHASGFHHLALKILSPLPSVSCDATICVVFVLHHKIIFPAVLNEFSLSLIELGEIFRKVDESFQKSRHISGVYSPVIDLNNTQDRQPMFELGRYNVLYHVGLFRMAWLSLAYSLASILGGMHISSVQFRCWLAGILPALFTIALGMNHDSSSAAVVTLCILLDAVFVKDNVIFACLLFASVWFNIFAHYKLFTESWYCCFLVEPLLPMRATRFILELFLWFSYMFNRFVHFEPFDLPLAPPSSVYSNKRLLAAYNTNSDSLITSFLSWFRGATRYVCNNN